MLEIGAHPPTNYLLKGIIDGLTKKDAPKANMNQQLSGLGGMVETQNTTLKKKFGKTVKKVIHKKTGKRIV